MESTGSKICINGRILEQINTFNYLGYNISYREEKHVKVKEN
jgi:hypothetical protein